MKGISFMPEPKVEIRQVLSARDRHAFIALPYRLYRDDPNFVPPLRMHMRDILNEKKNMLFGYGPHVLFLAWKSGRAVGRVIAGVDRGFNRVSNCNIAWISLFECEPDWEAAAALLAECERWARGQGMDTLRGPISPDNGDDYRGLLTVGYDGPPALLNAYNPPWYCELFDGLGFVKEEDLYGFLFTRESFSNEKLRQVLPYAMKKFNYRIDTVDKKQFHREVRDIHRILEETIPGLGGNWMALPSVEDVEKEARFLLPMVDTDFVCIARENGTNRPVGFVVAIPEYNQAFARLKGGRLLPTGFIRFLYYKRKINALRVFMQFVVPEYQNRAVNAAIFYHIFEKAMEKGIHAADGSTIGETNLPSRLSVENLGGKHYRTYRIYRKKLNPL